MTTSDDSIRHDDDTEIVRVISLLSSVGLEGHWNRQILETAEQQQFVIGVRCLAHTMQLVLK